MSGDWDLAELLSDHHEQVLSRLDAWVVREEQLITDFLSKLPRQPLQHASHHFPQQVALLQAGSSFLEPPTGAVPPFRQRSGSQLSLGTCSLTARSHERLSQVAAEGHQHTALPPRSVDVLSPRSMQSSMHADDSPNMQQPLMGILPPSRHDEAKAACHPVPAPWVVGKPEIVHRRASGSPPAKAALEDAADGGVFGDRHTQRSESPDHGSAEVHRHRKAEAPNGKPVQTAQSRDRYGRLSSHLALSAGDEAWQNAARPITRDVRLSVQREEAVMKESSLAKFVNSSKFELFTAAIILVSSLAIGCEAQYMASSDTDSIPWPFVATQYFCAGAFVVELTLRMCAQGRQFFWNSDWVWNYFDLFLVFSSVVEAALDVVSAIMDAAVESGPSLGSARIIRMLRITRLVRVLRMARIMRIVRPLRILVYSIVATLRAVLWALLLLLIIIYCSSILVTQGTTDYLKSNDCEGDATCSEFRGELRMRFGDLFTSMLTLYMSITGGVDYGEALSVLQKVNMAFFLLYLLFVTFTLFAVLNVVTGAFCQGVFEGKQYDRDQMIEQLLKNKQSDLHKLSDVFKNVFKSIDTAGTGNISYDEFQAHLMDDSVQALLALLELETADAYTLFSLLDVDESRELDPEEFVSGCLQLKGTARSIDLAKVMYNQKRMMTRLSTMWTYVEAEFMDLKGTPSKGLAEAHHREVQPPILRAPPRSKTIELYAVTT